MLDPLTIAAFLAVVLLSASAQTLAGFGFALLVMPLATMIFGLPVAGPLVAMLGLVLNISNFVRNRGGVDRAEALRLAVSAGVGIPLGLWIVINASDTAMKPILGLVLIAFATYNLAPTPRLPICSPRWVYAAGLAAGFFNGAYSTGGPPIVIYGASRQWGKLQFRGTLHAAFIMTSTQTIIAHMFAQRVTPTSVGLAAMAIPAMAAGLLLGWRLDRHIDHERFRTLVDAMILVLGVSLVLTLWK